MKEGDHHKSCSDSETDITSSATSSSSSGSGAENARRHCSKRKRSIPVAREETSSSGSSDEDEKRRKSRLVRGRERKSTRRKEKEDKEKRRDKRRKPRETDEKHGKRHRKKEKHGREKRRKKGRDTEVVTEKEEAAAHLLPKSQLQAINEVQMQQKALVWRNVEMAKAKLASGEFQKKKHEQMEMQRLYGTVDWREKKKLRAEKSRLERTVAAGKKLASIEERENARMDAFRVALGLPTAEAQRQAEWRAEATRALAEAEALKDIKSPPVSRVPSRSPKVIGPRLPS